MNSIFNKIFITKAEYSLVNSMENADKLMYLFDAYVRPAARARSAFSA